MVTDFHSHILPGIDDGSAGLTQSLEMLAEEARQGISHVVATPHFYAGHHSLSEFLEKRARAEECLRRAMLDCPGLPRISVGAEVHFFRGMSESDALPQLTISGKNGILIEMPPAPWSRQIYRELEEIALQRGLIPIVAHVDRYISPFRTHRIPQDLGEIPVLVQANAGFFLKAATAPMAMSMLRSGRIHLLGSDCHNMEDRKPNLGPAVSRIRQRLGTEALDRIFRYECSVFLDENDPE